MKKFITKLSIFLLFIVVFIRINTYSTALASIIEPTLTNNKKVIYVGKSYNIDSMINNINKSATLTYKSLDKSLAKVTNKGKLSGVCAGKTQVIIEISNNLMLSKYES